MGNGPKAAQKPSSDAPSAAETRIAPEVSQDIAEQKRVEQALQDSRERLLRVQRVARVGFLDWDLKTNEIFLSDETCELTGFRPEGPVATPDFVARSVHPDDLAYTGENLTLAISGTKPYDIVHRHLRPDGGIVWVHAQAEISRDEDGAPARLLGTIVDITEQKRVEQALRESERKYRELVEHANSIILHWTPRRADHLPQRVWPALFRLLRSRDHAAAM